MKIAEILKAKGLSKEIAFRLNGGITDPNDRNPNRGSKNPSNAGNAASGSGNSGASNGGNNASQGTTGSGV